ncbi:hypothetical protein BC831DRAFT_446513 [Entophlyctis helioformis]|nr:hypothetical protein BC831DRAFT_446513 [Entophlyctis helioformis]
MADRTAEFVGMVQTLHRLSARAGAMHDGAAGSTASAGASGASLVLRPHRARPPRSPFLVEADKIAHNMSDLRRYLLRIRRAYLGLGAPTPDEQQQHDDASGRGQGASGAAPSLVPSAGPADIHGMDEDQKGLLDAQIQTLIKGFLAMIQALARHVDAQIPQQSQGPASLLGRFAESIAQPGSATAQAPQHDQVKRMREAVIAILETRLMDLSNVQRGLQEHRLQRRMDRQERLHKSVVSPTLSARPHPTTSHAASGEAEGEDKGQASISLSRLIPTAVKSRVQAAIAIPASMRPPSPTKGSGWTVSVPGIDDTDDEAAEMSASRRLMLESENETLLTEMQGTLDLVRTATQSINEIAQLQSTLAHHVQAQNETIAAIHDDAVVAVLNVTKGNELLRKTKDIMGGPRLWVLWFMLIASALLLLLDYFS